MSELYYNIKSSEIGDSLAFSVLKSTIAVDDNGPPGDTSHILAAIEAVADNERGDSVNVYPILVKGGKIRFGDTLSGLEFSDGTTMTSAEEEEEEEGEGNLLSYQIDKVSREFTTDSFVDGWITDGFTVPAGSVIKTDFSIPARNDSTNWGGGYVEVQYQINSESWVSLGHSGYDMNVMYSTTASIGTYTNGFIQDFSLTESDFTLKYKFRHRWYNAGPLKINGSHEIGDGAVDSFAWSHIIVIGLSPVAGPKGDIGETGATGNQGAQGGEYDAGTTYDVDDIVSYGGSLWTALQETTGNTPSEGAYWTLLFTPALNVPIGVILPFGDTSAPSGYLFCDGSEISRETYSGLFSVIGIAYGVGNGSTTYDIPNFASKFPRENTPGATGGSDTAIVVSHNHTFSGNALGTHRHSTVMGSHYHSYTRYSALRVGFDSPGNVWIGGVGVNTSSTNLGTKYSNYVGAGTPAGSISTVGLSGAGANVPAYLGVKYIIKY